MVTYYNKKDLTSFGEYLLSERRKELYRNNPDFPDENLLKERLSKVSYSDVENWEREQKITVKDK